MVRADTMLRRIEHCDSFIVFGSEHYGEDTGNSASTYYESKFAEGQQKKIILASGLFIYDI